MFRVDISLDWSVKEKDLYCLESRMEVKQDFEELKFVQLQIEWKI